MAITIGEETKEESEQTGNVIIIVPVRQNKTILLLKNHLVSLHWLTSYGCILIEVHPEKQMYSNEPAFWVIVSTQPQLPETSAPWMRENRLQTNEEEICFTWSTWNASFGIVFIIHGKWTNLVCNTTISLFNFKRWQRICTIENMMIVLIVTSHKKAQGDAGIWVMKNLFLENYRVWQSQISLEGWVLCQAVSWNKDHSGMKTEAENGTANNPMKEGWP